MTNKSKEIDVFWSFRSPFSYLAVGRLVALQHQWDVAINMRPVYPLAMRQKDFISPANMQRLQYILLDCHREAERLDIPFQWPDPDPIDMDFASMSVAPEQPLIKRITRLGIAAIRAGHGLEFVDQMSKLIWGGTKNWHEDAHLTAATARAGLGLDHLEASVATDTDALDAEIEANHAGLQASGHWGVPTMVYGGAPFFGQDRIDALLWAMQKDGLQKR